ncbi:hypothetical protein H0A58_03980 [Alcaligenaceae bacterium]|nr:hypothetical protein [Alcaligenaceae bacterium]
MPITLAPVTSLSTARSSWQWLRYLACVMLCLLVAACGFRLKGPTPLPFDTIYTNIAENSAFGAGMRRAIVASSPNTRFVAEPADAQAKLIQLSNDQSLRELSIDAQGQVEEYELNLVFVFQLTDAKGHIILEPTTLRATREVPYNANVVQAKQSEISTVFKEMQQSMINRVVRHLSAPDVTAAFLKPDDLPIDDSQIDSTPQFDTSTPASPWGTPDVIPRIGQ